MSRVSCSRAGLPFEDGFADFLFSGMKNLTGAHAFITKAYLDPISEIYNALNAAIPELHIKFLDMSPEHRGLQNRS
jgi:hypothetical protein